MKNQNERNLIMNELKKKLSIHTKDYYTIKDYEIRDDYKIAISPRYGIFTQGDIIEVFELSIKHEFHFYFSDACAAFQEKGLYMIIY